MRLTLNKRFQAWYEIKEGIYHKEKIKSDSFYWGKKYKNKLLFFFWADFIEDWTLLISSCLCHTLTYLRRKRNRSCARTQMEVRYIRSREKKLCFIKQHAISMDMTDSMKSAWKQQHYGVWEKQRNSLQSENRAKFSLSALACLNCFDSVPKTVREFVM